MAVRRLLIVMLILLGVSTLLASQVPNKSQREGTGSTGSEGTETAITTGTEIELEGRLLEPIVIRVVEAKITVIPVELGDQLPLSVRSKRSDLVEIPALGLFEPVSPDAPAHFDILADELGNFGIRLADVDTVIGRIEVSERAEPKPPKKGKTN